MKTYFYENIAWQHVLRLEDLWSKPQEFVQAFVANNQCDQIKPILKVIGHQVVQIVGGFLAYFEKCNFLRKNNSGYFSGQLFIPTSGHNLVTIDNANNLVFWCRFFE